MGNKSSSHAASYHANASRVPPQSVPPYFGSASPRVPPQNVPPYFGSTSPSAPPILPSSHPLCTAINPAVIQHGQPLVPPPFHGSMNSVHRIGLNGIDSGYVTGPTDIEHWKSQSVRNGYSRLSLNEQFYLEAPPPLPLVAMVPANPKLIRKWQKKQKKLLKKMGSMPPILVPTQNAPGMMPPYARAYSADNLNSTVFDGYAQLLVDKRRDENLNKSERKSHHFGENSPESPFGVALSSLSSARSNGMVSGDTRSVACGTPTVSATVSPTEPYINNKTNKSISITNDENKNHNHQVSSSSNTVEQFDHCSPIVRVWSNGRSVVSVADNTDVTTNVSTQRFTQLTNTDKNPDCIDDERYTVSIADSHQIKQQKHQQQQLSHRNSPVRHPATVSTLNVDESHGNMSSDGYSNYSRGSPRLMMTKSLPPLHHSTPNNDHVPTARSNTVRTANVCVRSIENDADRLPHNCRDRPSKNAISTNKALNQQPNTITNSDGKPSVARSISENVSLMGVPHASNDLNQLKRNIEHGSTVSSLTQSSNVRTEVSDIDFSWVTDVENRLEREIAFVKEDLPRHQMAVRYFGLDECLNTSREAGSDSAKGGVSARITTAARSLSNNTDHTFGAYDDPRSSEFRDIHSNVKSKAAMFDEAVRCEKKRSRNNFVQTSRARSRSSPRDSIDPYIPNPDYQGSNLAATRSPTQDETTTRYFGYGRLANEESSNPSLRRIQRTERPNELQRFPNSIDIHSSPSAFRNSLTSTGFKQNRTATDDSRESREIRVLRDLSDPHGAPNSSKNSAVHWSHNPNEYYRPNVRRSTEKPIRASVAY